MLSCPNKISHLEGDILTTLDLSHHEGGSKKSLLKKALIMFLNFPFFLIILLSESPSVDLLIHRHFVPHNTTSNQTNGKDIGKGLVSMGFVGLIICKMVERPGEDMIVISARRHGIKMLLPTNS